MNEDLINEELAISTEDGDAMCLDTAPRGEPAWFVAERTMSFHVTPAQPCPYLANRWERKVWTALDDFSSDFGTLARGGFRRSHMVAYRPACPRCVACVPVRVRVRDFAASRSLRRVDNANADLVGSWRPSRATGEQFMLFQRYLMARHRDGEMADMGLPDFRAMIDESPASSAMMELRRPEATELRDTDGPLTAACLVDRLDDGLSAVYSFFEPGLDRRGLGTYVVLWLIHQAAALGLPYVYLGYWIAESRKMAYKARFRPLEGLTDGSWRDIQADAFPD